MTCEHAETTVLLYLYGEAPPEFDEHLADCVECQESLAEHAATVRAVEPVFRAEGAAGQRRQLGVADAPEGAPSGAQGDRTRAPARSRALPWLAAAAAAATLALLATRWITPPPTDGDYDAAADAVTPAAIDDEPWIDPLDRELDDLVGDFDSLARDLEEP